jgi:hypothetical protein
MVCFVIVCIYDSDSDSYYCDSSQCKGMGANKKRKYAFFLCCATLSYARMLLFLLLFLLLLLLC